MEIDGLLLEWIGNFLENRRQCVCVRGSYLMLPVESRKLCMFTDDSKIYRTVSSVEEMNILLHNIINLMDLNFDKI